MRIRFADRMMLEGTLPSTARIRDLYDFVKLHLAIPEADFVLCESFLDWTPHVADPLTCSLL